MREFTRHGFPKCKPSPLLREAVRTAVRTTSKLCFVLGLHKPRIWFYSMEESPCAGCFVDSGDWPIVTVNVWQYGQYEHLTRRRWFKADVKVMLVHELIHACLTLLQVDDVVQGRHEKAIETLSEMYCWRVLTENWLALELVKRAKRWRREKP